MADNVALPATGVTTATDDIGGVHYQRIKAGFGAEGSHTDVSTAAPLPVVLPKLATATLSNVASSATNVTVLAANANRQGVHVFNDSTAILYLKFGATASATSYTVQLAAAQFYEMPTPVYTGILDGLWASANGNARVTELVT